MWIDQWHNRQNNSGIVSIDTHTILYDSDHQPVVRNQILKVAKNIEHNLKLY